MKIKLNQSAARIILVTNIDFNTISINTVKVRYIKPSGLAGEWTATVLTGSETDGRIYVDFDATIKFDVEGEWKLWSYLKLTDTREAMGDTVFYDVIPEGTYY